MPVKKLKEKRWSSKTTVVKLTMEGIGTTIAIGAVHASSHLYYRSYINGCKKY